MTEWSAARVDGVPVASEAVRVLVAGMGSAIGTAITLELERSEQVEAIAGFDLEPPRRWMRRAEFDFIQPGDGERVARIVRDFQPTVVVHDWIFEPRSRSTPGQARSRTVAGTVSLFDALRQVDSVEHIVVRSSVSLYGQHRHEGTPPTVDSPARPTSTFGDIVARVEERAGEVAAQLGASLSCVRLAIVMASNLPNPLGRYLRLPVVPVPLTAKRFGLLHLSDAAAVLAAVATSKHSGPLNVMAAGPVTPLEATAIGRRIPLPMLPALFRTTRRLAELPGTPLPDHVVELLSRGQVVAPSDVAALGAPLKRTTSETIADLYEVGRLVTLDSTRYADEDRD